jgi:hypothetical protein
MITSRSPIRQRALKLPAKKRMSLAALLLESLEAGEADAAMLKDLKRRSEDLRSGRVKGLTTEQAYGFSL